MASSKHRIKFTNPEEFEKDSKKYVNDIIDMIGKGKNRPPEEFSGMLAVVIDGLISIQGSVAKYPGIPKEIRPSFAKLNNSFLINIRFALNEAEKENNQSL